MAKTLAPKTRTLVAKLIAALPDTRRDPDTIFEMLEASHGATLAAEQRELNRLALAEILNRVCKTRGRATELDDNQIDFWRRNRLKRAVTIVRDDGKKARTSPYDMSFAELESYVEEHTAARPAISKEVLDMKVTLDAVRPYVMDPRAPIGELWREKRAAEG